MRSPHISLTEYLSSNLSGAKFESEILYLLDKACNGNERIAKDKSFPTSGFRVYVDFYLKEGIHNLNLPENTVIEYKKFLDSSILRNVYDSFIRITKLPQPEIKKFILVYSETNFSAKPTLPEKNDKFEILSYDEFIEIVSSKLHSDSSVASKAELEYKKVERKDSDNSEKKDWITQREQLLEELKRDLGKDLVTLFLGAGVSASAKMPGWGKLLESLLTKHSKDLSPDYLPCDLTNVLHSCGDSYIIAARYINYIIDESTRAKIIQETLYKDVKKSDLIESICKLIKKFGVFQAITTNYDQLVEQKLKEDGIYPFSVSNNGMVPKGAFPVYHVHGSVNDPNNPLEGNVPDAPVLSEEDYHTLYATGHHWSNTAILHALQHTHCVFIGLSMTDPNLRRLFESARSKSVPHYVFLPRIPLYEGYYEKDPRNIHHFEVQEKIMESLGIRIIWYKVDSSLSNPHKELETLINSLKDNKVQLEDNHDEVQQESNFIKP